MFLLTNNPLRKPVASWRSHSHVKSCPQTQRVQFSVESEVNCTGKSSKQQQQQQQRQQRQQQNDTEVPPIQFLLWKKYKLYLLFHVFQDTFAILLQKQRPEPEPSPNSSPSRVRAQERAKAREETHQIELEHCQSNYVIPPPPLPPKSEKVKLNK